LRQKPKVKKVSRTLLIVWISIIVFTYALMLSNVFGLINPTGYRSEWMLDAQVFYDRIAFRNAIGMMDADMIRGYMTLHIIDYVFIFTFYPLLAYILFQQRQKKSILILLPLIAMGFDFLENILIDIAMHITVPDFFATISGYLTLFKFIFIVISVSIIIYIAYIKRTKK